ncbi:DNA polymerase IV [Clostridium sp. E02]|uniref:DNA polymerase Y family protein n=1 Tax=Clostridium sp. E02 TaxID=2487134 RepID=UPI000F545A65|nr:DNA polymerase IV [Clostridium sp. E02]
MNRVIFHIDVNSAFLSWEAVYRQKHLLGNLDLRVVPSAVGGDVTMRHGIILAKSIPAKKYGIHTGQSVTEALRQCPSLLLVPPNYNLYQRSSEAFIRLLKEYSPKVEQYSIDEAYVDMTGMEVLFGAPEIAAALIGERIKKELGFTVNIGVSENKVLAKMASDFKKPDRVHTLWCQEIPEKLWPLPVSELFFVGRATFKKLYNIGIKTIGDLAESDPGLIKSHLGKMGEQLYAFSHGVDGSKVEPVPPPNKGYGNSTTIAFDITDRENAHLVLLSLAETLAVRLREDKVRASVLAVGIKDWDFHYYSHQVSLYSPTNVTKEIFEIACDVFDQAWDKTPVRHLGIHMSHVTDNQDRQISFFEKNDYEKLERLDQTVDQIRKRFGNDAIKRAVFLESPEQKQVRYLDHMSGGISREKRTVDYGKQNIR